MNYFDIYQKFENREYMDVIVKYLWEIIAQKKNNEQYILYVGVISRYLGD